ncbi:MAG: hypothetical protein JST16_06770 [Bdellovibrionales bacterium]|nr:hypothetical protein [Bdellovibrionales bacterium]
MKSVFERLLGIAPWKPEWQEELSATLTQAQKGLSVSMVVVIARESDLYAEVLFLLSFLGLSLGVLVSYFCRSRIDFDDLILIPLLGFALGSTLFAFRRFFINRMAPRAIRDRVANRAKAHFFDHDQHLQGQIVLLYFSELEREALLLTSPELIATIPKDEVQRALSKLIVHYTQRDPMHHLSPCLLTLGDILRRRYGLVGDAPAATSRMQLYIQASDRPSQLQIPILKGNKDIN